MTSRSAGLAPPPLNGKPGPDAIVREYPLIFSGASVRAILSGAKTQTRRPVQRHNVFISGRHAPALDLWEALDFGGALVDPGPSPAGNPGPYLKVAKHDDASVQRVYSRVWRGNELWVKERLDRGIRCERTDAIVYAADGTVAWDATAPATWTWARDILPAMFCPRGLSRLTLVVTEVRVGRLQEITEADAVAEGVTALDGEFAGCFAFDEALSGTTARECFARYWDALNYQRGGGWDTNPWVWIYTFQKVPHDAPHRHDMRRQRDEALFALEGDDGR